MSSVRATNSTFSDSLLAEMTPKQALSFVKTHGIVLESARGPVPNLAETIAGQPISGSWWQFDTYRHPCASEARLCKVPANCSTCRRAVHAIRQWRRAHVWRHAGDALINYNKLRIARADHSLSIDKACHVNRDPAAVHEHEIRVPDQPEMARPVSLDEELLRMPPKSEHFPVTRLELLHVHFRLARALHLRLALARTRPSFSLRSFLSATLNFRLSTHFCAGLRFGLRFTRLRRGVRLFLFCRSCLRLFFRLLLRPSLLLLRCLS